jgi:hypothetical protein
MQNTPDNIESSDGGREAKLMDEAKAAILQFDSFNLHGIVPSQSA